MLRAARSEVCNETEMMACGRERFFALEMPSLDCNCYFFLLLCILNQNFRAVQSGQNIIWRGCLIAACAVQNAQVACPIFASDIKHRGCQIVLKMATGANIPSVPRSF